MSRMMNCHRCNSQWDIDVERVYPFSDDEHFTMGLMCPLCAVDVSPKIAFLCHECMHELIPRWDMWITEEIWNELEPATRSPQLPSIKPDKWEPEDYYID